VYNPPFQLYATDQKEIGVAMKDKIHPKYGECKVRCGCGNEFVTRSTESEVKVEICSACHPFFTGTQKIMDTMGRVDRFQKKFGGEYFVHTPKERKRGKARK
jgi:large subunit ribosomal protein L31